MAEIVLHIGMMKTGTTYLQKVFDANRELLESKGFVYPKTGSFNHQSAFYGLCGSDIYWNKKENDLDVKSSKLLLDSLAGVRDEQRVVLSSEAISTLDDKGVERLLKKIGTPHKVILTARNLQKIIPSAWQQYIKGGNLKGYVEFYESFVRNRGAISGPWRTYAFGEIAGRWSKFCSVDVIVVDDSSPEQLWFDFCSSIGLSSEAVVSKVQGRESNQSLCMEDVEILKKFVNKVEVDAPDVDLREKKKLLDGFIKRFFFSTAGLVAGTKIKPLAAYRAIVDAWNIEEVQKLKFSAVTVIGNYDVLESYGGEYIELDELQKNDSELLEHFLCRVKHVLI